MRYLSRRFSDMRREGANRHQRQDAAAQVALEIFIGPQDGPRGAADATSMISRQNIST